MKTSKKSEAEGRDPSATYALVDENDEVRRFGRSKAACTARKLGADCSWNTLHNTINERMLREQEMITRVNALKASMQTSEVSLPDSLTSDVNAIKQSATLSTLGVTVSNKRIVKMSDGSTVSASELQAHSMMKTLEASHKTMAIVLSELTASVKAKSHVALNDDKVADYMSWRIEEHFQKTVQEPVYGLRSDLQGSVTI